MNVKAFPMMSSTWEQMGSLNIFDYMIIYYKMLT